MTETIHSNPSLNSPFGKGGKRGFIVVAKFTLP
jgi:hypothetical protein